MIGLIAMWAFIIGIVFIVLAVIGMQSDGKGGVGGGCIFALFCVPAIIICFSIGGITGLMWLGALLF